MYVRLVWTNSFDSVCVQRKQLEPQHNWLLTRLKCSSIRLNRCRALSEAPQNPLLNPFLKYACRSRTWKRPRRCSRRHLARRAFRFAACSPRCWRPSTRPYKRRKLQLGQKHASIVANPVPLLPAASVPQTTLPCCWTISRSTAGTTFCIVSWRRHCIWCSIMSYRITTPPPLSAPTYSRMITYSTAWWRPRMMPCGLRWKWRMP